MIYIYIYTLILNLYTHTHTWQTRQCYGWCKSAVHLCTTLISIEMFLLKWTPKKEGRASLCSIKVGVVWPPSKVRSGSLSLSIRLLFAIESRMSWGFATSVVASNRPDGEISAEEFSLFGYLSPYFQAPELPIQRGLLSKFGKGPDSPLFHRNWVVTQGYQPTSAYRRWGYGWGLGDCFHDYCSDESSMCRWYIEAMEEELQK